jgi:hypothetical protein
VTQQVDVMLTLIPPSSPAVLQRLVASLGEYGVTMLPPDYIAAGHRVVGSAGYTQFSHSTCPLQYPQGEVAIHPPGREPWVVTCHSASVYQAAPWFAASVFSTRSDAGSGGQEVAIVVTFTPTQNGVLLLSRPFGEVMHSGVVVEWCRKQPGVGRGALALLEQLQELPRQMLLKGQRALEQREQQAQQQQGQQQAIAVVQPGTTPSATSGQAVTGQGLLQEVQGQPQEMDMWAMAAAVAVDEDEEELMEEAARLALQGQAGPSTGGQQLSPPHHHQQQQQQQMGIALPPELGALGPLLELLAPTGLTSLAEPQRIDPQRLTQLGQWVLDMAAPGGPLVPSQLRPLQQYAPNQQQQAVAAAPQQVPTCGRFLQLQPEEVAAMQPALGFLERLITLCRPAYSSAAATFDTNAVMQGEMLTQGSPAEQQCFRALKQFVCEELLANVAPPAAGGQPGLLQVLLQTPFAGFPSVPASYMASVLRWLAPAVRDNVRSLMADCVLCLWAQQLQAECGVGIGAAAGHASFWPALVYQDSDLEAAAASSGPTGLHAGRVMNEEGIQQLRYLWGECAFSDEWDDDPLVEDEDVSSGAAEGEEDAEGDAAAEAMEEDDTGVAVAVAVAAPPGAAAAVAGAPAWDDAFDIVDWGIRQGLQLVFSPTFAAAAALAGGVHLQQLPRPEWGQFQQRQLPSQLSLDQLTVRLLEVLAADGLLGTSMAELRGQELWDSFISSKPANTRFLHVRGALEQYTIRVHLPSHDKHTKLPKQVERRHPMLGLFEEYRASLFVVLLPPFQQGVKEHLAIKGNPHVVFSQWSLQGSVPVLPAGVAYGSRFHVDFTSSTSEHSGLHALAVAAYLAVSMLQQEGTHLGGSLARFTAEGAI